VAAALMLLGTWLAVTAVPTGAAWAAPANATAGWTIVTTPNVGSGEGNVMDAVSCPKAQSAFCMAVGGYYTGTSPVIKQTEIQQWNGTAWKIVKSPNATGTNALSDYLGGVSCPTTKFCMAAGYYTQSAGLPDQTLIEKWNGTSWKIVSTPDVSGVSNDLTSVSCPSAKFCIAAGYTISSSFLEQTVIEEWNGTSWSIVNSPDTSSSQDNFLWGVSCPSASFCMADGYYDDTSGNQLTLIEELTGGSWKITPSPNGSPAPSTALNSLWSVSCVTSKFCMAAGDYWNSSNVQQNLIEKWAGSSWKIVPSPDTSSTLDNGLYAGVSCTSTAFCMDTTQASITSGYTQTLALEWAAGSWKIVPSQDTSTTQNNRLQAASCPTTSFCLSVGQYRVVISSKLVMQNLAELWQ
jgi:putative hemolysin